MAFSLISLIVVVHEAIFMWKDSDMQVVVKRLDVSVSMLV